MYNCGAAAEPGFAQALEGEHAFGEALFEGGCQVGAWAADPARGVLFKHTSFIDAQEWEIKADQLIRHNNASRDDRQQQSIPDPRDAALVGP